MAFSVYQYPGHPHCLVLWVKAFWHGCFNMGSLAAAFSLGKDGSLGDGLV